MVEARDTSAEAPVWRIDTASGPVEAQSVAAVMFGVDQAVKAGHLNAFEPIPTGFQMLDHRMGGGLRVGELALLGGVQGVGKTNMALQMARNLAFSGEATCLYVCFEHDESSLLQRLISQESIDPASDEYQTGLRVRDIQSKVIEARKRLKVGLLEALAADPRGEAALKKMETYADRLFLLKGSSVRTTPEALQDLVATYRSRIDGRLVLFIDYLQRVPVYPEPESEADKVTKVVEALKGMALAHDISVVSIVAADKEGLKAQRLRLHHLRGSSALTYEADIVLILNEKYRVVSKTHIAYNLHKAQAFHDWLICSIEKNRAGRDQLDIEFQKKFEYCCLDPRGGEVQEVLVEERIYTE
ncbi:MAG: DnaB-like helicase C-terminal domain-containing protein [Chloroflexota bacterium]